VDFYAFAPLAEFTDRYGMIRPIPGCSLLGRKEFFERLQAIAAILKTGGSDRTWQQLYDELPILRHHLTRCLVLNGIDPDGVTLEMLESLVFSRMEGDEIITGRLVELNQPKAAEDGDVEAKAQNLLQILAALSLQMGGVKEALELASNPSLPADALIELTSERVELQLTPEEKGKRKAAKQNKELRKDFDRLMAIPVGDS
jgi:hypothetical protein